MQKNRNRISRTILSKRGRGRGDGGDVDGQCDQMAQLSYHIWPFTTMPNCPVASKYQINLNKLPKDFSIFLSKWGNFTKSGHTGDGDGGLSVGHVLGVV